MGNRSVFPFQKFQNPQPLSFTTAGIRSRKTHIAAAVDPKLSHSTFIERLVLYSPVLIARMDETAERLDIQRLKKAFSHTDIPVWQLQNLNGV